MTFSDYRVAYFAQKWGAESASLLSLCTAGFPPPCAESSKQQSPTSFSSLGRKDDQACPAMLAMATAGINITGRDTTMKECGPMKNKKKPFLNGSLQDLLMNIHLNSRMLSWGLCSKTVPFTLVGCPQWKLPVGLQLQKHLQATRGSRAILC